MWEIWISTVQLQFQILLLKHGTNWLLVSESVDDVWVTKLIIMSIGARVHEAHSCAHEQTFLCHFHVRMPWRKVTVIQYRGHWLSKAALKILMHTMHNANCIFFYTASTPLRQTQPAGWREHQSIPTGCGSYFRREVGSKESPHGYKITCRDMWGPRMHTWKVKRQENIYC